jgi:DNA modification methylase
LGEPKVFGEVIMLELNKVYCGDCLELMKEISVDICDNFGKEFPKVEI